MFDEILDSIQGFCKAIMVGDVTQVLSFFNSNATLVWGPFIFSGVQEIENWIKGLFNIFPKLNLRKIGFNFQGNNVRQNLIIESMLPNGSIARMPCVVVYNVRYKKIHKVVFNLSFGYITVLRSPQEPQTSKT